MSDDRYAHINRWNVLLDELCNRAGFLDTASLASRFCELANNGGQRDFDTAVRNLNNWRSGRHIPRLRSLRILEQLLDVSRDPELQSRWNALYRQASEAEEDELPASATLATPAPEKSFSRWIGAEALTAGAFMFIAGLGIGLLINSDWRPWSGPADDAPLVEYTPEWQLAVGESKMIHAERGDCGKLPRDWPLVAESLPVAQTGFFSDGGLVRRPSKFCGGITPGRGVIFTATAAGVEELRIQGDYFRITVTEAAADAQGASQ